MTRAARTKTTATVGAAQGTAGRPQAPTGVWLLAGTRDEEQPYPCMCHGQRACTKWCPCRGRTDLSSLPTNCCAHTTTRQGDADGNQQKAAV